MWDSITKPATYAGSKLTDFFEASPTPQHGACMADCTRPCTGPYSMP